MAVPPPYPSGGVMAEIRKWRYSAPLTFAKEFFVSYFVFFFPHFPPWTLDVEFVLFEHI